MAAVDSGGGVGPTVAAAGHPGSGGPKVLTARGALQPFYFGGGENRLFGCLHSPVASWSGVGVVLCYPQGPEYTRSHRAFRVFAERLSRVGCAVLRFDYSGCGDSGGEHVDATLSRWRRDIRRAVSELATRLAPDRIVLAGRRLGGSLAAQVAVDAPEIDGLVLWDPVIRGERYVAELVEQHGEFVTRPQGFGLVVLDEGWKAKEDSGVRELMGYDLSSAMLEELADLDLSHAVPRSNLDILLVETREPASVDVDRLARSWRPAARGVEHRRVPDPEGWEMGGALLRQLVPNPVLKTMVDWLRRIAP